MRPFAAAGFLKSCALRLASACGLRAALPPPPTMVTLDRGLEEAAALLYRLLPKGDEGREPDARIELAIMAVDRARELLSGQREMLHHEDW